MRIPLMPFSIGAAKKLGHRFRGVGRLLGPLSPGLDAELISADLDIHADEYRFASLFTAFFYGVAFLLLITAGLYSMTSELKSSFFMGLIAGLLLFFIILAVLLRYPRIISGKEAEDIDKDLVYALKEILLSVSSGLSMFNSLSIVARGPYGKVSKNLRRVVDRVNTGVSLEDAMEELAISTPSEHFQNALWQIVNTSKSGADVSGALRSLTDGLVTEQRASIQKYSHELNILTLLYMLVAVAIPTIVITLMIILNSFIFAGVSKLMFIVFISASLFVQLAIIGLIKSRRPVVRI